VRFASKQWVEFCDHRTGAGIVAYFLKTVVLKNRRIFSSLEIEQWISHGSNWLGWTSALLLLCFDIIEVASNMPLCNKLCWRALVEVVNAAQQATNINLIQPRDCFMVEEKLSINDLLMYLCY
jgi:hypothetical protein